MTKLKKIPEYGDRGTGEVRLFQMALFSKGFDPGAMDDWFGMNVKNACSRFQRMIGLEGSGIPGPKTMSALGFEIGDPIYNAEPITIVFGEVLATLSWELPCKDSQISQVAHPERKAWSEAAFAEIWKNYDVFMSASDIKTVLPDLDTLSKEQRCTKLAELLSAVAKYECSWNPSVTSKDVNGSSEKNKLAIGLFQMNVGDQAVYHTGTSFTHEELKNPLNNIQAAVGIIVYLIQKRGTITFIKGKGGMPSAFFETLLFGAKYENVQNVLKMVSAMNFSVVNETTTPSTDARPYTREEVADKIVSLIQTDVNKKLRESPPRSNRGPRIDTFNRRTNVAMGSPWCASGGWCAIDDACKAMGLINPMPPTASSQAFGRDGLVPAKYIRNEGDLGKKGDVGTLQDSSDKNHGHHTTLTVDQTEQMRPEFSTAEYNTDASGVSNGDGAYNKKRSMIDLSPLNNFKKFVSFADIPQWIIDTNY